MVLFTGLHSLFRNVCVDPPVEMLLIIDAVEQFRTHVARKQLVDLEDCLVRFRSGFVPLCGTTPGQPETRTALAFSPNEKFPGHGGSAGL